jgi:hypothetical protein
MNRTCTVCQRIKPIKGGRKVATSSRGTGQFVCADCTSHARVISGTGNAREQKQLAQLIRALSPQP